MRFDILTIYLAVLNIIGVLINVIDKYKAKHNKWRIKEATLWSVALLGGAVGSYLTMNLIHHKTKHKSFMLGFPIIIIVQTLLLGYVILKIRQ